MKTNDRAKRTTPKTADEIRFSGRYAVPAPLMSPIVLL